MNDCIVLKSKENFDELLFFCKLILVKNYTNLKIIEYANGEIRIDASDVSLVAPIISEYIVRNYIYDVADEILANEYEDYDDFLIQISIRSNDSDVCDIIKALEEKFTFFSKYNKNISFDGFALFAFNEFKERLIKITKKLILNEQEDEDEDITDFIMQLRTYVNTKPVLCNRLHVVIYRDGSYRYFNTNKKNITKECVKKFYDDFQDEYAQENDILLNTLITKLPREIVFHKKINKENENLFNTIQNIFGGRVRFCSDDKCKLCKM